MNYLFRKSWFPLGAQLAALVVFILLMIGGFGANTSDMGFAHVLRNTNLANLFVWSYWWPLIIILSVFFGRLWCTVCPVELITSLSARFGLRKKAPKWLRSGWIITIFYVVILFVGIQTFAIHRVPLRMALYLTSLVAVAILVGLIFSKNSFCAYVCPVGHLLGLYARLAPFGWKVKDQRVCEDCKDKPCMNAKNLYNFQAKSCGVNLVPPQLDDNTHCLVCGQCAKACEKYNEKKQEGRPNPGWFRRPWAADLLNLKTVTSAQAFFLIVVSGFVIYEVWTEWPVTKSILLFLPTLVQKMLLPEGSMWGGIVKSLLLYFILPLFIWAIPYFIVKVRKTSLSFNDYLTKCALLFIPIMAAGHLVKALLKTTSRIPYITASFGDPLGIQTAQAILDKQITLPANPVVIDVLVTVFGLLFLIAGVTLSFRLAIRLKKKIGDGATGLHAVPVIYGGIFVIMFLLWRLF